MQLGIFQFRISGIPGRFTADTCVTDTCDFFRSLTRLTRPPRLTRPTCLTRSTRLTRITGPPAFTLLYRIVRPADNSVPESNRSILCKCAEMVAMFFHYSVIKLPR